MERMLSNRYAARSSIKLIFAILILLVSTTSMVVYLRNREISEKIFFREVQDRQLTISKTSSKAMELFLNDLRSNIFYISKIEGVSSLNEKETRKIYKDFIQRYKNFSFLAISRFDSSGKMIIVERGDGSSEGERESFSDRSYYMWAKDPLNKDKILISKPFTMRVGPSKGKYAIMIAVPAYFKDKFTGVAAIAVVLDKFADTFVVPYRVYNRGDTFIINGQGTIISSSKKSEINNNLGDNEYGKSLGKIITQDEGKIIIDDKIIAFNSILVDKEKFYVVVANNKKDLLLSSFLPLANNQKNWLIIILSATISSLLVLIIVDHIAHREGFLKGLSRKA